MVDAAPFRALRYDPAVAGDPATTSAPAYDDVGPLAFAHHRTVSPYTVLQLFAAGTTGYAGARATLHRWCRTGVLVEDATPGFYVYEQHELRHGSPTLTRGVLAAVRLEPPGGAVLVHEDTDVQRVEDRVARLRTVPVDLSPVYAVYNAGAPGLDGVLAARPRTPPLVGCTDETGIDHRVWPLRDEASCRAVRRALADVRVVVADGHHRYASALALAQARGADDGWSRTLMYLVDARAYGPQVLPVHRLVRTEIGDLVERLSTRFHLAPVAHDVAALGGRLADASPPSFGVLTATGAFLATGHRVSSVAGSTRWHALDTALVDYAALPALGAAEVSYVVDAREGAAAVQAGAQDGLLLVRPVDVSTVVALATGGERLPPKSTWFHPKPRTGLVMRTIDEQSRA